MPPAAAVLRPEGDTLIADWPTVADNNTYIDAPLATPTASTPRLDVRGGYQGNTESNDAQCSTPELAF